MASEVTLLLSTSGLRGYESLTGVGVCDPIITSFGVDIDDPFFPGPEGVAGNFLGNSGPPTPQARGPGGEKHLLTCSFSWCARRDSNPQPSDP